MKKLIISEEINDILQQKNSFLNRADMRVFPVSSPEEALRIHRTIRADMLIIDAAMPASAGGEFCATIRTDAGAHPVFIILVDGNCGQAGDGGKCRPDLVVSKTFKPARLLKTVKEMLRVSWRETYRALLTVAVEGCSEDQMLPCHTLDISTTGMMIETVQAFKPGDRVVCSFILPDLSRVEVTGEIVRYVQQAPEAEANWYGVHFTHLKPAGKQALEAFLTKTRA